MIIIYSNSIVAPKDFMADYATHIRFVSHFCVRFLSGRL